MHVIAPEGVSMCRSKYAKGVWVEKAYDYVIACSRLKERTSDMQVIEDFELRPHTAVTFVVERGKERQEWRELNCRRCYWDTVEEGYQGEAPEKKGREEGEEDEGSGERRVINEIIEEVIKGMQKMASQRPSKDKTPCKAGIARRLEKRRGGTAGKKATRWQNMGRAATIGRNQKNDSWKLLKIGCHVLELVVNELMSQGKRVKSSK